MFNKIICFIFLLAGLLAGSQLPEFVQQYSQRLAGQRDILQKLVENISKFAAHSDRSLEAYIQKFLESSDPDFQRQGEWMAALELQLRAVTDTITKLNDSTSLSKSWVFFTTLDTDVAKATLSSYQPAVNISFEGLIYGSIGLFVGYLSFLLFRWVLYRIWLVIKAPFSRKKSEVPHEISS